MKYLIASDLHGSAEYVGKLMGAWERESADALLLLGDLLYHGPRNALPDDYDTQRVIAMLNPLAVKILAVRGNCDAEVDQMVLDFPIMADSLNVYADGRRFFLTHGHLCAGGRDALRAHPRPRRLPVPRGRVVFESRLGVHPEKRLAPQLYDLRGRALPLEDARRGDLPGAGAVNAEISPKHTIYKQL